MNLNSIVPHEVGKKPAHGKALWGKFWIFTAFNRGEPATSAELFKMENEAVVIQPISLEHPGRISFEGSEWPARCDQDVCLLPGSRVYVIKRKGVTQFVQPSP